LKAPTILFMGDSEKMRENSLTTIYPFHYLGTWTDTELRILVVHTDGVKCGQQGPKWLNAGLFIEGVAGIAPTCRWSSR